ncbi:predicted protein [Nematostella vectensis]|uniref:Junctophilin n=1 Tax=Nematostella vectensis TaxID=45351 RepID=A7S3X5_NEMVE|nr:junctophilin-1 [Nematostella vectensis]EDO41562.1 predicted protein [Nematostella vectensis]|eukprot:XP_001633625.1 predicted protein [Nematostella vectensis]
MSGGRFDFEDGGTYCGEWRNGKAHGYGICTGPKGQARYEGSWHNGFELSGVYVWPNGHRYEGEWYCGKRHGLGVEYRGKWIYQGEWEDGFKARYGVQRSQSGARYEGSWTSGLQEGYGIEVYANGGYYYGQWKTGMRSGYGIRSAKRDPKVTITNYARSISRQSNAESNGVIPTKQKRQGGELPPAEPHSPKSGSESDNASNTGSVNSTVGSGSTQLADGSLDSTVAVTQTEPEAEPVKPVRELYKGDWKNDKRHGYGILEASDGYKYIGQWHENMRHGLGVACYPDSSKYEGEFENDNLVVDIKKKGPIKTLVTRFRQRLQVACEAAQQASDLAVQKSHMALSRATAARDRALEAAAAAENARQSTVIAKRRARELMQAVHISGMEFVKT